MKNPYTSSTIDQDPRPPLGFAGVCGAGFVCASAWTLVSFVFAYLCHWDDFHQSFASGLGFGVVVIAATPPVVWLVVWGVETACEWHWRWRRKRNGRPRIFS